ncbi:MAG: DUF898 family protein, partial [candidate division NC10 bacterium]
MSGAKCRKCGLMQMPRPTCKSCGTPLNSTVPHYAAAPASTATSAAPSRTGPMYLREEPPPPSVTGEAPPHITPLAADLTPSMAQEAPPYIPQAPPPSMAQEATLYPAGSDGHVHGLFFHGTGGSLFGIHIVNMFLTVITLGIYYFWGKTKVRNYLWSQTDFAGDRFAY